MDVNLNFKRNRLLYLVCLILVVPLGLGSRKYGNLLPVFVATYSGDVLYAVMIYLFYAFLFPSLGIVRILLLALVTCFAIEFLELYKAHWIQNIRHNRLGGLILGFDFAWSDLICYTVGISIVVLIEVAVSYFIQNSYFRTSK